MAFEIVLSTSGESFILHTHPPPEADVAAYAVTVLGSRNLTFLRMNLTFKFPFRFEGETIYCSPSVWLSCMRFTFKFSAELTHSLLICVPSECSDFRIALISEPPYQMQSGSSAGHSVSSPAAWHFPTHPRMFLPILPVILHRWQFPRKFLILSLTSSLPPHRMPVFTCGSSAKM